ncbi:ribonuclease III [Hominifimenecus sp. rT4P-3]|uniref:ribonuclease III n=1 Tax=Hominifimenecus sp. rT4P-3 TaxID=3242979 RepID=UPI003DA3DB48
METLEQKMGYVFQNRALLRQALMHSSYVNEHHMSRHECNERLEFLGDAVLELSSSQFLYEKYPDFPEGELTKLRASIVCEPTLADCAETLALGKELLMGHGEERTGGREKASLLSDALEAVIGAIYLDGGFANAKEFVERFILNDIEHKKLFFDSKTILQELVQRQELGELSYELLETEGPDHCKVFTSCVKIQGKKAGVGTGRNKKLSEQAAAYEAIRKLGQ